MITRFQSDEAKKDQGIGTGAGWKSVVFQAPSVSARLTINLTVAIISSAKMPDCG
jgi:hypothetical protein